MALVFRDFRSPSADFGTAREVDWRGLAKIGNAVAVEVVAERQAAGAANPHEVPVIHRHKKDKKTGRAIYRVFNLSPQYPGRLGTAEALVSGQWRLATAEEVLAEAAFNKKAAISKLPKFLQKEISASTESEG